MSSLHDVIHTLIDVASGAQARLAPHEATLLHDAIDAALAEATKLEGPDVSAEPAPAEAPAQPANMPASPPYAEPYDPPAPADVLAPPVG